jgi:hypothetical protein
VKISKVHNLRNILIPVPSLLLLSKIFIKISRVQFIKGMSVLFASFDMVKYVLHVSMDHAISIHDIYVLYIVLKLA